MKNKRKKDIENIIRMKEIAKIYTITKQKEKSEKYHKNIIKICDQHPKNEEILIYKMQSQKQLNKTYKSLETTKKILKINPNNINALLNLIGIIHKR
ncbi:MAG: hypothetical protein E7Z80_08975 [Methanobrevibacter thaueri]|nr:hypothetical protein [Methanobrevibacter thaueri]